MVTGCSCAMHAGMSRWKSRRAARIPNCLHVTAIIHSWSVMHIVPVFFVRGSARKVRARHAHLSSLFLQQSSATVELSRGGRPICVLFGCTWSNSSSNSVFMQLVICAQVHGSATHNVSLFLVTYPVLRIRYNIITDNAVMAFHLSVCLSVCCK